MIKETALSKKLFFGFFLVFAFTTLKAQELHLSQPLMNPILQNPAHTGNSDSDWRLMANYRSQWRSMGTPFISNIIGGDKQLYLLNQSIGVGALVSYDRSGDGNLTNFSAGLMASLKKEIGKTVFRGGFRVSYVLNQFDVNRLTFPQQYDRTQGGFNQQFNNGESAIGQSFSFFDFTLGTIVEHTFSNRLKVGVGFTVNHLNQPSASFLSDQNQLDAFFSYQAFANYQFNEKMLIKPFVIYSFLSKASQLLIGADVNYALSDQPQNIDYFIGGIATRSGFNRTFDALVLKAGLGFEKLEVGVSYDFTMSSIRQVSDYRGALEFGVILKGASNFLPFKTLPCERL